MQIQQHFLCFSLIPLAVEYVDAEAVSLISPDLRNMKHFPFHFIVSE